MTSLEGWCSLVRFYASGDQLAGTEFRSDGWWHPSDMSAQHAVAVRTRLLRSAGSMRYGVISWPGQNEGLFADQEYGVQAAPGR